MTCLRRQIAAVAVLVAAVFACSEKTSVTPNGVGSAPSLGGDSGTVPPPTDNGSSSSGGSDASPDTSPSPEVFVNVTNETMQFDGETRTYVLAKPVDYDATKSYPLVIAFHGNPGLATDMAKGIPFDAVSKKEAVIVYPQADSDAWDLYTPTDTNADMHFIEALPGEINANKANIDSSRIYGFGFSGGAFFITQFTCRFGGIFRAISVNAGGGPDEPQMGYAQYDNGCYICPGGPVAAIVTHGTADVEVDPSSGEFTRACYATTNGCADTLSTTAPSPCQRYDGCSDKPVEWCLIPGLGHGLWANATSEAWAFFKAAP